MGMACTTNLAPVPSDTATGVAVVVDVDELGEVGVDRPAPGADVETGPDCPPQPATITAMLTMHMTSTTARRGARHAPVTRGIDGRRPRGLIAMTLRQLARTLSVVLHGTSPTSASAPGNFDAPPDGFPIP
jgi:hypothetical protein